MPDIIFMDIQMPVMDGRETAGRIWEAHGRDATIVVAISASTLDHERQEILQYGFDGFVPKPFRAEEIYSVIADRLNVTFEHEQPEAAVDDRPDFADVKIPEPLYAQMLEAAELYSVTELEQRFDQLAALGDREGHLADHLRQLRRNHDIDAIVGILKDIAHV